MKYFLRCKNLWACLFVCVFAGQGTHAQVITTIAGDGTMGYFGDGGPATTAWLGYIIHNVADDTGNVYVVDNFNDRVRKISNAGIITTFAGSGIIGFAGDGGPAIAAELGSPSGIARDKNGNTYISEGSHRIRKVDGAGIISTIAGTGISGSGGDGGPAIAAQFVYPVGLAFDTSGNLYIADATAHRIRRIDSAGIITTFAGTAASGYAGDGGPATLALLMAPFGVAVDRQGNVYIADPPCNTIRKVTIATGIITTVAGTGVSGFGGDGGPASAALLSNPEGIAVDTACNLYISEHSNNRIRKVDTGGIITTFAGTGIAGYSGDGGPPSAAEIQEPTGVSVDRYGNVYISDWGNFRLRKIYYPSTTTIKNSRDHSVKMEVSPNPSHGTFSVLLTSDNNEPVQFFITGISGARLFESHAQSNRTLTIRQNLPPGNYFLSACAGQERYSVMFVVE